MKHFVQIKLGLIALLLCAIQITNAQVTTIDFETALDGYNSSSTYGSGTTDIFNRTNTAIGGNSTFYWAAEDITSDALITLDQIDVTGSTSFSLSVDLLTPNSNDWDAADQVSIFYSLDGGADQNLLWIRTTSNASNEPAAIDADFNGLGDMGKELPALVDDYPAGVGSDFATFSSASISLSGNSTLDIRIEFITLTSNDEGLYLDNIVITEVAPSSCVISDIAISNAGACNDNGTPSDDSDDYYEADVTVTYVDAPGSGNLQLSGAGVVGGTTSAAIGVSPQTITGVRLLADGNDVDITANFSTEPSCTYSETVLSSGVASCSDLPTVGFTATTSSVTEGDIVATTHDVNISMDSAPSSDATIEVVSIEDTATEGDDYDAVSASVTFTTGESYPATKMVSVTINGDLDVEPDETFDLLLSLAAGSAGLASVGDDQHTVTIENNDVHPLVINEIHADPASGTSGDANADGTRDTEDDEFIEFYNNSDFPLDISGFTVSDGVQVRHTFPGGTSIPARTGFVLFGGGDVSAMECPAFVASSGALGLNNSGDDVIVEDGADLIVSYSYGGEGGSDESLARNPDFTGDFVQHTTIVTHVVNFSPCFSNPDGSFRLPVVIENLEATVIRNENVLLSFTTATEQNNSHFLIQRSTDGRSFETIGRVEGKGNSDQRVDYSFVDANPELGLNYYRLHQFDFDGASALHGPVAARFGEKDSEGPRIWPVPTSGLLQLELPSSDDTWELSVYDLNGQMLQSQQLESKSLKTSFDLAPLPAGTYLLQWQNGQQLGQQRIVKL